jgi:hypothetical protein
MARLRHAQRIEANGGTAMHFPADPIAFIDSIVDELKRRLKARPKVGETLRYMGETLDQQGRGEDFYRIFVCNPKPKVPDPHANNTDLGLLELYEHWRSQYGMRPIEPWDGTRLRPWLPAASNPQVPEVLRGDLSIFDTAITRAPGTVTPWRRLDALGHAVESYFTLVRRHAVWSRALRPAASEVSVAPAGGHSHLRNDLAPSEEHEKLLHETRSKPETSKPVTSIEEVGNLRLYFHNELNNIETAPYSVRFWGFLKWADNLRRRLLGLPVENYSHDGESDIAFMDAFNMNHFPWHDDVFARGAAPSWEDQYRRKQTHKYPMGSQGYGVEFYLFHRELIDAFDAWMERNGRPAVTAWHSGKNHTAYVLKYAWDWHWGRGGTNGRPLDPNVVAPELLDPQLSAFETLAELGNYLDVCGVAYHGIGHVQNCDIRDPYCNNYSIRFYGWHRWIDDLFKILEAQGKPIYDESKPLGEALPCVSYKPVPDSISWFDGIWTYRSFINDPDSAADVRWFVAEMELRMDPTGKLKGMLRSGDPKYEYRLEGYIDERNVYYELTPDWWDERAIVVLTGIGATPETAGHKYEYRGYLQAQWPTGKGQTKTFSGSMIRAVRPDNPALEGTVGSFTAVFKSALPAAAAIGPGKSGEAVFIEDGTFEVPPGVSKITIKAWGAGGGGGSDGPGIGDADGASGGSSGVYYFCEASGGEGGQHGVYQMGGGGSGGNGVFGDLKKGGASGETGGTVQDLSGAGGAGANSGGAGGSGVGKHSNGQDGLAPGGGGSGALEGNTPAGGGGGGGYAEAMITVNPGQKLPVYVGAGGAGGDGGYRVGGSGARGEVRISW